MSLDDVWTFAEWYFNCDDEYKKAKIKSVFLDMIAKNSKDLRQEKNAMERFELRCEHLAICARLDRLSGRNGRIVRR